MLKTEDCTIYGKRVALGELDRQAREDKASQDRVRAAADTIQANSGRFDPDGLDEYNRVLAYQTAHKCSWSDAMEGERRVREANDRIMANSQKFDADGLEDYRRAVAYQAEHKCSYSDAVLACC